MHAIFKKYSNLLLDLLAVIFLCLIMGFAAYGADQLAEQAQKAFGTPSNASAAASFDVKGASSLDFHGLTPQ
jgi:Na+/H+-dicarboxylate symporter